MNTPVKTVPARLIGNPNSGWTVYEFTSAREAAMFVQQHPECAMPCWRRCEVINGELFQVC